MFLLRIKRNQITKCWFFFFLILNIFGQLTFRFIIKLHICKIGQKKRQRQQKYPEKTSNLPQVSDKLYHIKYTSPWTTIKLTTLVEIGTDYIDVQKVQLPYKNNFEPGAGMVVIIWQLYLQLPVQSVPITTNIVSSNSIHGEVYSIHYVMKFVSDF